jgi:hypothetical protein
MSYTCNPSYSGGRDQEDHSSKPANNLRNPISTNEKLGTVAACACHPNYPGSVNRRVTVQAGQGIKNETLLEK